MRRQLLAPVGAAPAAGVVAALGAVASQVNPADAELGIRLRSDRVGPGDVARAVTAGELLRTFAFRGAVHLMTPDDAAAHLALRASSRMSERASWRSYYRLDPADWPPLRAAVRDALADGPLTSAELAHAVCAQPRYRHLGAAFTHGSATFLKPFAWQGDLALTSDGRLIGLAGHPGWPGLPDLAEAGRHAIIAYLAAYAPASETNVRYWLGEGLGVRRGLLDAWLADLADRVATVEVEGESRLVLREDLADLAAARPAPVLSLLPRYDQWVLGPGTADARVVPGGLRDSVSRGANLVVVDGVVAGSWSLRGDVVEVACPVRPADLPGLDEEVSRLGAVLGRRLSAAPPD